MKRRLLKLIAVGLTISISRYIFVFPFDQALLMGVFLAISSTWLAVGSAIYTTIVASSLLFWPAFSLGTSASTLQAILVVEICMTAFFWVRGLPVSFLADGTHPKKTHPKKSSLLTFAGGYCRTGCLIVSVAAFVAPLFHASDLVTSLRWAFLYFSLYLSLRASLQIVSAEPESTKRPMLPDAQPSDLKPQSRIRNAALLIVSLLLSLVLLEFGSRLILPAYRPPMTSYIYDPKYLFLTRPNADYRHSIQVSERTTQDVVFHLSSLGFRDREYGEKEHGEYRILMLGDSFTMGHATRNDNDTIPKLLESILTQELDRIPEHPSQVSVINAGCGGAGPIQELGMLERGLTLKPDLVILEIFPQNDIENSLELVNKRQRAYDVDWQNALREYQGMNIFPYRAEMAVRRASCLYRFFVARFEHNENLIARFFSIAKILPSFDLPGFSPNEDRPSFLEVNLKEWYPELEEGFDILKDDMVAIVRMCSQNGADFIAYTIPDYNEVSEQAWASYQEQYKGQVEYVHLNGLKKVAVFLEEQCIPNFTIFDALKAHGHVDDEYYRFDGHLSEIGNSIASE
ncbi:MAG: SGNH/GDSL hydrolase family protein, partial [Candidatus Hydrogenedentes bacterium]|nr:SGNH/GDSL hydrolase family protein [Candidatus Hydrogenedentota bacterium]